jgi:NAD(P)-dependent dehydrogenase (short-subunit alcohol dehydrogenase family)
MLLKDKVAMITGSAGALGSVTTRIFLENGAKVVALYHREDKFNRLRKSLGELTERLNGIKSDVTVALDCERAVRKVIDDHRKVDILINLVGGWSGGKTLEKTDENTWDYMMNLNAKSVFLCCKAVLPFMVEKNYGKIVNISAKSSMREGRKKNSSVYAASKGAVRILTQALTEEFKEKNINVNCVMPSTIDTEYNRKMMPKADYSKWVPLGQLAETILFLCSDNADNIKGACIPVYGRS